MPSSSPRWVITLRDAIKREHGLGWSVRQMSGRIQLTRRFDDGTRSGVTLDLSWSPGSMTAALSQIKELRERIESAGLSIKEALQPVPSPLEIGQNATSAPPAGSQRSASKRKANNGAENTNRFLVHCLGRQVPTRGGRVPGRPAAMVQLCQPLCGLPITLIRRLTRWLLEASGAKMLLGE